MSGTFQLHLRDTLHEERFEQVTAFVGEDESGSFGILARHARFMTVLTLSLARFETTPGQTYYLGLAGGLAFMRGEVLAISTQRFVTDTDFESISQKLRGEIAREALETHATRESLRNLEDAVLKRLYELGRKGHKLA